MDIATIIGIVAAFGLMLMAILQGGGLGMFIDVPSMLIVFGGTIGVALINYPLADILGAVKVAKKTFLYQETSTNDLITQLIEFANKARKEGILSLQALIDSVDDQFLVKALQMAVDGQEPEDLKTMLNTEIEYIQDRHSKGAEIFLSLGTISPAMGMVGTLIGLVQMLQNMSDPSSIGPAMAVALLTTFYGAVIANILCNPMAGKLKTRSKSELLQKTIIVEGMGSILSGENPRIMEQKLHAFVAPSERESSFN
ncbi:chemotaxis protein MotA [Desulfolithobacter dissulfuricans]|uniref:Chemotaxis protein MotA n=1 Tax=Desulfolithobacter dissulfuricans TaxID=2795293 RepID=A0A915U915_9BACT|nr:MotA/TolQ/ExbB proton channel family protein [Desulfolithobacter dissulfuricans]BCO08541.1 chemotaxis protein MotA [Desulfolithobacter dissulfuricans]